MVTLAFTRGSMMKFLPVTSPTAWMIWPRSASLYFGVMVAPSWGWTLGCGTAGIPTDMSTLDNANTAAYRRLDEYSVGFTVMGTRMLNGFDRRFGYSFEFSLGLFGCGFGGVALLAGGVAPVFESFSRSLVACAATCAIFKLISCFWPPRSMVTVT